MYNWITSFKKATTESKLFFLTLFIFGFPLVLTTIYCYERIQAVRDQKIENNSIQKENHP